MDFRFAAEQATLHAMEKQRLASLADLADSGCLPMAGGNRWQWGIGIPTVLVCVTFLAGVQLFVMGVVGEYVGRIFLHLNGKPQFIVRYERTAHDEPR